MHLSEHNTASIEENGPISQLKPSFYSVELLSHELQLLYQFKIWNFSSDPMFILVKEGSGFLEQLKVGQVFKSKYYSTDSLCPTVELKTRIAQVVRSDQGRFKGYYVIRLAIINSDNTETIH